MPASWSKLSERQGDMMEMRPSGGGRTRLVFHVPTRGLIGYQGDLLTDTRGTAVMNRLFHAYAPYKGEIPGRRNGVLISNGVGEATAYALFHLQDRGHMHDRSPDPRLRGHDHRPAQPRQRPVVNVVQGKKLTNVRAAGKDEALILITPLRMTLERAMSYIQDDELVEITPKSIRLRKRWLDPHVRKWRERAKPRRRLEAVVPQSRSRACRRGLKPRLRARRRLRDHGDSVGATGCGS